MITVGRHVAGFPPSISRLHRSAQGWLDPGAQLLRRDYECHRTDYEECGNQHAWRDGFSSEKSAEQDGNEVMWRVTDIADGKAVLDGNHELAGQRLRFDAKVIDVRPATQETATIQTQS